jgi:AcrR family transcriptional regulator
MSSDGRARRLPAAERRRQLLALALRIVREEGADRLTLGRLALKAGVTKPVAYDHFQTRSGLLIQLYRWIDTERIEAFRSMLAEADRTALEAATMLAAAYIRCAADKTDGFHAVGAALAGSVEKAAVFEELLKNAVSMFVDVLRPHSSLSEPELERYCTGLVGAGEGLSAAILRGDYSEAAVIETFSSLISAALGTPRVYNADSTPR